MPFKSMNPTNPRTNLWNFHENFLRIEGVENLSFSFDLAILDFFFQKKKKNILLHPHENQSTFIM